MVSTFTIITFLSVCSLCAGAINTYGYQYQKAPNNQFAYQPYQSKPQQQQQYVEPSDVLKSIIRNDYMGNYVYGFETSDGIVQRQAGEANGSKRGYYSYVGTDGKTYTVCYIADELGYRIVGDPKLGAVKEIQCPYDLDKRRPNPLVAKKTNNYDYKKPVQQPSANRRNGYGYDKPSSSYQAKNLPNYPLPGTNPFVPPHY